jgi:TolA-binding protein
VALQPSFANAQYFLGLSDVKLGRTTDAISIFSSLAQTNPDNQTLTAILSALKSGKQIFANPPAASASAAPLKGSTPKPSKK